MDVRDEDGDSQPDKFDFELTNFNPHGSSTRFFKQPSSVSSAIASKPSVIHEITEVTPADEAVPGAGQQQQPQQQRQQLSTVTTSVVTTTTTTTTEKTNTVVESSTVAAASLLPPTSRVSTTDEEKTKSEITAAIASNTHSSLKVCLFVRQIISKFKRNEKNNSFELTTI